MKHVINFSVSFLFTCKMVSLIFPFSPFTYYRLICLTGQQLHTVPPKISCYLTSQFENFLFAITSLSSTLRIFSDLTCLMKSLVFSYFHPSFHSLPKRFLHALNQDTMSHCHQNWRSGSVNLRDFDFNRGFFYRRFPSFFCAEKLVVSPHSTSTVHFPKHFSSQPFFDCFAEQLAGVLIELFHKRREN